MLCLTAAGQAQGERKGTGAIAPDLSGQHEVKRPTLGHQRRGKSPALLFYLESKYLLDPDVFVSTALQQDSAQHPLLCVAYGMQCVCLAGQHGQYEGACGTSRTPGKDPVGLTSPTSSANQTDTSTEGRRPALSQQPPGAGRQGVPEKELKVSLHRSSRTLVGKQGR